MSNLTTGLNLLITSSIASSGGAEHSLGWGIFFYLGIVLLGIVLFIIAALPGFKERIPQNIFSQLAEHLFHFIESLCVTTIGKHGRKYVPFILTLWLFIFVSNVFGLVFPHTPTADWGMNLSLSIITILYVQYEGIRAHGFLGHLKHFAGPKLPFLMALFISPLLFSIELVSEAMKMISLSLRLYCNIYGGHLVVDSLNGMAGQGEWPIGGIIFPIKLLASLIQALVFTMLACVYLSLVTSHKDEHEKTQEIHSKDSLTTAHAS